MKNRANFGNFNPYFMYGGKMNFTVSRNDLYKALQKIINVIPSKSTIEILYNVLLIA